MCQGGRLKHLFDRIGDTCISTGDGVVSAWEQCDEGFGGAGSNGARDAKCLSTCLKPDIGLPSYGPVCGDGIVEGLEECGKLCV